MDAREHAYGSSGLRLLTSGRQDNGLAGRLRVEEPVGFLGLLEPPVRRVGKIAHVTSSRIARARFCPRVDAHETRGQRRARLGACGGRVFAPLPTLPLLLALEDAIDAGRLCSQRI